MKCEYCDNEVPQGSTRCPSCGAAIKAAPVQQAASTAPAGTTIQVQPASVNVLMLPKSRMSYVLLAIFLGGLGIHNFYAGYSGRGIIQLLISLIVGSFTCGVASCIVWIWAVIEACVVTTDARGVRFA